MKRNEKPVLMPSAISAGFMLWSGVFVLYFFAALTCFMQWNRLREARAAADAPRRTQVSASLFSLSTPIGWEEVSLAGDAAILRRKKGEALPAILISARRNPDFRYRVLDSNPALLAQTVGRLLAGEPYMPPNAVPTVLSVWPLDVRPGVHSVNGTFSLGEVCGCVRYFYVNDIRYCVCAVWKQAVDFPAEERGLWPVEFFQTMSLGTEDGSFARPQVDSSNLSADEHAKASRTKERELALWRLYAARAKLEPAGNLLPAIEHFRLGLEAASSVREERTLVESPEFSDYQELLEKRRAIVREWFVQMDKCRATGDYAGALKQADYIIAHATLGEESLTRHRAQKVRESLADRVQPAVKAK